MESFLFIASMLVVGIIISVFKFKYKVSDKIWKFLSINKIYLKVIITLMFVMILTILVSFIVENLNVSPLMEQIIRGAILGLTFLFIPSSIEEAKKR